MELLNATPLLAAYTQGLAADGRESLVVIAKGTFELPLDGSEARLAASQRHLLMADEYVGEPGLSAPAREMDFAPYKPFCDVLVHGKARAPGGQPVNRLTVGVRVGRVSKAFAVTGPRQWQPGGLLGVRPGEPQSFVEQAISYADAFGGCRRVDENPELSDALPSNPCGQGWFPSRCGSGVIVGMPMPTSEALNQPVEDPYGNYPPMSLGPIGRAWTPRIGFAGSYDEAWLDEHFPFLPPDFDERYFQAAPPDQQTEHLRGGEDVLLLNLTARERAGFQVPRLRVPVTFFLAGGGRDTCEATIDTLSIDTDAGLVEVTWRARRPLRRNLFEVSQVLLGEKSRAWWRARELGKGYHPSLAHLSRSRAAQEDD